MQLIFVILSIAVYSRRGRNIRNRNRRLRSRNVGYNGRNVNRCGNNGNNNRGNGVIENVYDKNTDKTNVKLSTKPFNGAILNYETNPTDTIGKIKSFHLIKHIFDE